MLLYGGIAYHDYEGVAVDPAERERLVQDLGEHSVLILRNHGTLTCGEDVPSAFLRMYFLERACEAQVAAQAGGPLNPPPAGTAEATGRLGSLGLASIGRGLAWPALRRRLDRIDGSYRD